MFALGAARVWCTDRRGGVSRGPWESLNLGDHVGDDEKDVAENRARLAGTIGFGAADSWVWLDQVHGADVYVASSASTIRPVADAAVTAVRGLPLAVVTADCAPIALAGDGAVGVVHAGHRGLLAGVVERAVAALRECGSGPVRAVVGPCIGPARYEFGEDDLGLLVETFGATVATRTADGRAAFDVPRATLIALGRAGVYDVTDCGVCTYESPNHFSHRRDRITGRQATVVVLP